MKALKRAGAALWPSIRTSPSRARVLCPKTHLPAREQLEFLVKLTRNVRRLLGLLAHLPELPTLTLHWVSLVPSLEILAFPPRVPVEAPVSVPHRFPAQLARDLFDPREGFVVRDADAEFVGHVFHDLDAPNAESGVAGHGSKTDSIAFRILTRANILVSRPNYRNSPSGTAATGSHAPKTEPLDV